MAHKKIVPGTGGKHYIPYKDRSGEKSTVYFTEDFSAEGLKKIFERVSGSLKGKIAVKLHTGEQHGPNIIPAPWVKELIADKIVGLLGADPSPILLLLVIFIVTCVLTNFMSNTATTALMIPIAVSLANNLGADPRAVVIATVIAGSCAYATPIGMPANTMVVGLGGYKFKDYVKSGLPLILVSFVICMILLPILFPFYP